MEVYRLRLFAADVGRQDVTKPMQDTRTRGLSDQRHRALGSISANLAEGHSRSTGRDRARFYEYALGSARESQDGYYKGQRILREETTADRIAPLHSPFTFHVSLALLPPCLCNLRHR